MLSAFCGHLDVVKTIVENVGDKDLLQVNFMHNLIKQNVSGILTEP